MGAAVAGVAGYKVDVEVDLAAGLPMFDIVGLPGGAVKESRERIRAAIKNAGFTFPVKRITINLAPADMRKHGPGFDLPMAVGILACMGNIKEHALEGAFFAGELSLDGAVRPIAGVLPMLLAAREAGAAKAFVAAENAAEAALVSGVEIFPVDDILCVIRHFSGSGNEKITPFSAENAAPPPLDTYDVDFAEVAGQAYVKRALTIAAAGYHNALMIGPPGAGKTMLARRMPTIMPDLSAEEALEITKIHSIAGLLDTKSALVTRRPFRTPHHTASYISMTGGGKNAMPGEISLAHGGVLFLDELPEFQKKALETMRQPLEDGQITIARVGGVHTYPSVFLFLAAMNPCPCGYLGTPKCNCTDAEIARYVDKISGPLLDRIDIHVEAAPIKFNEFSEQEKAAETSADIKLRVEAARARQKARFSGTPTHFNGKMTPAQLKQFCPLNPEATALIQNVFDTMALSARAYHKILKLSRTIADLADSPQIHAMHIAEAISYRTLDRKH
jgi:magnesium chelatase family protein